MYSIIYYDRDLISWNFNHQFMTVGQTASMKLRANYKLEDVDQVGNPVWLFY